MAAELDTNAPLTEAVQRARAAAEADGSLHPRAGDRIATTPEFREAVERLTSDGTYAEAVAAVISVNPDLA